MKKRKILAAILIFSCIFAGSTYAETVQINESGVVSYAETSFEATEAAQEDAEDNHEYDAEVSLNEEEIEMETESAKGLPQQVNYYGPVVHGNVTGSQIVSGSGNTATFYGAEAEIIHEVKESLEKEAISEDDMETAIELLEDISEKLSQNKKPGVIKAALSGLKDFLLAAGADITAALIVAKMQGMF